MFVMSVVDFYLLRVYVFQNVSINNVATGLEASLAYINVKSKERLNFWRG